MKPRDLNKAVIFRAETASTRPSSSQLQKEAPFSPGQPFPMAFPLPRGIMPPEIAFLAEMEQVTVVPRQRLEGLELLSVSRVSKAMSTTLN